MDQTILFAEKMAVLATKKLSATADVWFLLSLSLSFMVGLFAFSSSSWLQESNFIFYWSLYVF